MLHFVTAAQERPCASQRRALLVALLAVVLACRIVASHQVVRARGDAPPEVLALMPPGSTLRTAEQVAMHGAGLAPAWVLLVVDAPRGNQPPAVELIIVEAASAPGGWAVSGQFTFDNLIPMQAELGLVDVDGLPGLVVQGPIGAHAMRLAIVRFVDDAYAVVFDGESGAPDGLTLADLDEDGLPEVVRREPSYCVFNWAGPPHLLTVSAWDGARFTPATGRFPALLAEAVTETQDVLDSDAADFTGRGDAGRACLYGVLAFHARAAGDDEAAAASCARAAALDPAWAELREWAEGVCG